MFFYTSKVENMEGSFVLEYVHSRLRNNFIYCLQTQHVFTVELINPYFIILQIKTILTLAIILTIISFGLLFNGTFFFIKYNSCCLTSGSFLLQISVILSKIYVAISPNVTT